jgi:hypothetical protein
VVRVPKLQLVTVDDDAKVDDDDLDMPCKEEEFL